MAFDPEQNGWTLREAIMRVSDPADLAAVAQALAKNQSHTSVWWWDQVLAPPAEQQPNPKTNWKTVERAFAMKLARGELIGWARYNSPVANYDRVPTDAWGPLAGNHMLGWNWAVSAIFLQEVKGTHIITTTRYRSVFEKDSTGKITGRIKFEPYIAHESKPKREITLRLFGVRIQSPTELALGGHASRIKCTTWLCNIMRDNLMNSGPRWKKEEAWIEAKNNFAVNQHAFNQSWKQAIKETNSDWNKPGRSRGTDKR